MACLKLQSSVLEQAVCRKLLQTSSGMRQSVIQLFRQGLVWESSSDELQSSIEAGLRPETVYFFASRSHSTRQAFVHSVALSMLSSPYQTNTSDKVCLLLAFQTFIFTGLRLCRQPPLQTLQKLWFQLRSRCFLGLGHQGVAGLKIPSARPLEIMVPAAQVLVSR